MFPFGLGGQACTGPARERVGFEQAQMAHWRMRITRTPAFKGEFASVRIPVQRTLPALRLHHCPAIAEPGACAAVATVIDELLVFGITDHAVRQCMRTDQHAVARRFVVVGESRGLWPRRCANLHDLLVARMPAQGARRRRRYRLGLAVSRLQRIAPQRVLDVSQQQFLVLLLVLDAQLHDGAGGLVQQAIAQAALHLRIDGRTVVTHLLQRWPRQHTPARARMHRAYALVVAVEQEIPRWVEHHVLWVGLQHEAFKEPGGVCHVPFAGAGVGHALHHGVFRAQGCGKTIA